MVRGRSLLHLFHNRFLHPLSNLRHLEEIEHMDPLQFDLDCYKDRYFVIVFST